MLERNEISLLKLEDLSAQERRARLLLFIEECLLSMLKVPGPLPRRKPLNEIGVDSYMAVRLRHALEGATGHRLPVSLIFNYPTLEALAEHLTVRWATVRPAILGARSSEIFARLKDMSEDDARTYLAAVRS